MKIVMDKRHKSIAKTAIWAFTICLLIGIGVWRFDVVMGVVKDVIAVFAPVIWGLVISYLFNPLMNWIERQVKRLTDRQKPHPRLARVISVAVTILALLAVIFGLLASIVPELLSSLKSLFVNLPTYLTNIGDWVESRIAGMEQDQPQLHDMLSNAWVSAQDTVNSFAGQFEPKLDSIASGGANIITAITSGAFSFIHGIADFLIGIIFAIYLLYNKERYIAQMRKLLYATLPEERVHKFLNIGSHVSYTFMHFLSGKTLDSLIIGLLCFIGMTILDMPYIPLISIVVGITNIIPFFGPIIGAIPCGVLILLSEPGKVIPFAIFILVLQQFDGNILGPKILGDQLGLPMFWTLFAIIVGGGLFGFIGMVAFVPIFAAVYTLMSDFLQEKLKSKGLPSDDESYFTNEIHYSTLPAEGETPAEGEQTAETENADNDAKDEPHLSKSDIVEKAKRLQASIKAKHKKKK
ncbi:MAG: AI-2E family transporter [Oscillospiraceae bacterium]|nr:AI-2E family transporter [Oscillospiraceae bacterium]